MPTALIEVETKITRSPRVMQVEGIFDVPPTKASALRWQVDLPIEQREWQIGLIVGPSGSGKSTRHLFGDDLVSGFDWPSDAAVIDGFPKAMSAREVTELLSSVGFSSPPAWLRPFRVLSNGEQFRATMARLMAEQPNLAVVDEFTSVVDRTVAQIGSAALSKAIRRRNQKLIAVTCHEDVEEWLQPDWVYRPAGNQFRWRSLQPRPPITLEVWRVKSGDFWPLFRGHHYLSADCHRSAVTWVAFLGRTPVGFSSWVTFLSGTVHHARREHRTVVLPDYQGIGVGNHLSALCASVWAGLGYGAFSTTSHPAMVRHRNRSPLWRMHRAPSLTSPPGKNCALAHKLKHANDRLTAGFKYVGPPMPAEDARRLREEWWPG